jgi:ABC-type multidrug transport system ATPase subunit/ABC-type multidrug transport system permease subunit
MNVESVIEINGTHKENSERAEDMNMLEENKELPSIESKGLLLSCSNLCFSVLEGKGKKTKKKILKGITASFRPGRVTAVMGSSGAGKTTLLSLLAGDAGNMGAGGDGKSFIDGQITLNGKDADLKQVSKLSGFVYQDDVILPTMTVKEAIMMSARLRLSKYTPENEIQERCSEMMRILSLHKCSDTIIGSAMSKGISGGERKRVALAMELIPNPSILFLDEPTSGLDTVNAYNVVSLLSDLAHQTKRTIIVTIHQPPSEIFHMLDDLLLLADGRVVYHGTAADAVPYFTSLGHPCPMYTNPADFFFLELLGDIKKLRGDSGKPGNIVQELCTAWESSQEEKLLLAEQELAKIKACEESLDLSYYKKEFSGFDRQFSFLVKRAGLNLIRDKMILGVKALQTIVIALLIGLVYLNVDDSSKEPASQLQDTSGALYFLILNQFMGSSMGILSIFSKEKIIFLREHKLGYYKLAAYFLSKVLVELPYQIFFPMLLVTIAYYMVGFRAETEYFFTLMLIAVLTALNGMAMGTLAASAFKTVEIALVILPLLLIPMMLFSGLMINSDHIPWYFVWFKYIAPTQYAFTAAMKNQFTDFVVVDNDKMGFDGKPLVIINGNSYLKLMAMDGGLGLWGNVAALAISYFVLMALAYLSLFILSRRRS